MFKLSVTHASRRMFYVIEQDEGHDDSKEHNYKRDKVEAIREEIVEIQQGEKGIISSAHKKCPCMSLHDEKTSGSIHGNGEDDQ